MKEKFLTGKERMYVVELDNGDFLTVKKPQVFQYDFDIGEKIKVGMFPDDIHIYKHPENLQNELALQ